MMQSMVHQDTIAAVATALGAAGVGIVRVSGPEALAIADALYRTAAHTRPETPLSRRESHRIHHGWLVDPTTDAPLDEALVLVMKGPKSFTGEDVVEFQTHGGVTVLHSVLDQCLKAGARLAAAGEFTKRAFLNGRLDLTQAEAINDLINASTERSLSMAIGQLEGNLSRAVARMRSRVIDLLARLEAAIDYPDEIEDLPADETLAWIDGLLAAVGTHLATAHQGHVWREGASLAIVGRPNVGKSSLLNALLGRERAIVTDIPGTTRDVLEESLNLHGVPFRVVDTAGIRETEDVVEAIGVERSRASLASADVVLLVVDLGTGPGPEETILRELVGDRPLIVVGNKQDLLSAGTDATTLLRPLAGTAPVVPVAASTGVGLDALATQIVETALGAPLSAVSPTTVNARHRAALVRVDESLKRARESAAADMPADFVAIDLKDAIAAMGEITGDAIADEVIDTVFAQFCVGK
jgi:tRNA modification GTPase